MRARIKYLDTVPDESASLRVEEIIVSPCESDLHLFSVSESERLAASSLIVTGIASFAPVFCCCTCRNPSEMSTHFIAQISLTRCQGDYDGDFNRAIETANRLSEIDLLYIDDTPGLSLAQIISESRRIKREKGCVGMILVDYLTLMTAEKADRNDLAYGMITKGLKNLSKELDCVVVLLTQLNRALESRTNKRPLPSDSRDTGQIEQDCDYWVGIHREGAFDDSVPPGETELILRLNRHGNTGTVYCIQANGAIYDTDQQSAEMRRREREEPQSKKKGGF